MRQFTTVLGLVTTLLMSSVQSIHAQTGPANPDFEMVMKNGAPAGWFVPGMGVDRGR